MEVCHSYRTAGFAGRRLEAWGVFRRKLEASSFFVAR